MASESQLVSHRGVTLMLCDSEAILEETLLAMDTSKLHIQRIGDRAIVAPAYQLEEIREAMQERGTYPKVIGDISSIHPDEDEDESEEAEEASSEDDDASSDE